MILLIIKNTKQNKGVNQVQVPLVHLLLVLMDEVALQTGHDDEINYIHMKHILENTYQELKKSESQLY